MVIQYGSLTINACEMEPIPNLPDIPPAGMKIIITGSPVYHNQILFLKSCNAQVVGGEIPALLEAQKQETEQRIRTRDPLVWRPPLRVIQNS
jgi:hypothetical protein